MNHVLMNWTVHAETMTALALILLGVLAKVIQNLSKRLSKSRLTLETDSFALTMQTKQGLSRQESQPQELGGNDDGRRDDVNRGIPGVDPGNARTNANASDTWSITRTKEAQRQEESQTQEGRDRSQQAVENQKW